MQFRIETKRWNGTALECYSVSGSANFGAANHGLGVRRGLYSSKSGRTKLGVEVMYREVNFG